MDILTLILLFVIVILMINSRMSAVKRFHDLEFKITRLQNVLIRHERQRKAVEKVTEDAAATNFASELTGAEFSMPHVEQQMEVVANNLIKTKESLRTIYPPGKTGPSSATAFEEPEQYKLVVTYQQNTKHA